MRVIQLGPFPPPHGGVQTNLVSIRDYLRAQGHQAGVVHLTRHRRENADEVYYPETAAQTARLLWRERSDILHVHIGGHLNRRLVGLCAYCRCVPGRKVVLTFHSGGYCSSPEGRAMTRRSWAARVFQRLDAVIAVNQEIADFMLRCGVGAERVHLISPHAPVQAAAELPAEIGAFFAAHDPVLLSVGLLEPEYDLPLQIRVLERVRRNHQNAGLVMIGSGSREAELRALMAEQPYREHMLLTGDVPHASTVRAIQDCRMLLRTTHYDGDALSVREALDLGTPVIATDNGMRPPACRLIPAPPAIDPLAARIEELLQEPVGARQAVGQSDTKNLEAVLGLYRSIL